MADTLGYYDNNAEAFVESTFAVGMAELYAEFFPHIPDGGHILDAGCGSGRDALYFHHMGYRVSAFDASAAIVKLARQKTGLPIEQRAFSDVTETAVYDGIWACASLLHLREKDIADTIARLWYALRPEGIFYISFKAGEGERTENCRHFTDANEEIVNHWVNGLSDLKGIRTWRSPDKRPGRDEQWLNIVLTKQPAPHEKLTIGGREHHFLPKLCHAIKAADRVDLAVAFVKTTGLSLLTPDLVGALQRQSGSARLRILTSDYLDITDPEALRKLILLREQGAEVRVYQSRGTSFHMKAYLFAGSHATGQQWGRAFIGSSNISRQALQDGLEWNYQIDYPPDSGYLEAISRFEELFRHPHTVQLTDQWVDDYDQRRIPPPQSVAPGSTEQEPPPVPTLVQKAALAALDETRQEGYRRGLVVLATGLGKTWLSAFDAVQLGARRVLFVAHREEILYQAAETYLRIKPNSRVGFYMGQQRDYTVDILCASIQTLGKESHLDRFSPTHFDYIVVDEFHHAAAPTYHRLLNHFAPQFLLGLTATPDRTDRSDILSLCDDNVVYEYPLFDGIKGNFLVPFHYYGIFDSTVDYAEIPWRNGKFDPHLLANKLATLGRARHALRTWRQYKQSRTLSFCVSRQHADFMADRFRREGVRAASVHGESEMSRGEALEQLEAGQLDVIFSVDLFNEGVDLPAIDTVLLLRPTESKILFLQQIGRGLRNYPGKEKLVVLDFVGNHQSFMHKPQALMGRAMNHRELADFARNAESNRLDLPEGCFINYELEIIEFLKGLDQKGAEKDYQALKETLGRRPTLTEYYHFGSNLTQTRKQHGSWFGLLNDMGDLTAPEAEALIACDRFLREVEITSMSKSFKMILLEAFQSLNGWRYPPTLTELSAESWQILSRRPRLFAELAEAVRHLGEDSAEWQKYWKRNPVDHWTNKKPPFFQIDRDRFVPAFPVPGDHLESFELMVQELINYRLASYEARVDAKAWDLNESVFPIRADGTELPYFPTLKIACGHFRSSRADAEEYRILGRGYGRLDPSRHFVARASGDSMTGGKNPVLDGDYLLLEQVNPERAGSITGKTLAIERLDEAGDTQYLLRTVLKKSSGEYLLRAANPDYEDVVVTPELGEQLRTFARLEAVISPLDMSLGQEFRREDIPELFGETFSPGNWQSGHVFLKDTGAHVLLVTLNKQGKVQQHRYVDHWIDGTTFHWQSQNATTPEGKRGRELIDHQSLGLSVHLFVRENKLRNGKAAPFTYFGPVEYQRHEGRAPMSVIFRLAGDNNRDSLG
jgi:superfamily II DNA or RNA helicase/SAM-dependent methyltransferase/SOS-response transcriptional repressor LexA